MCLQQVEDIFSSSIYLYPDSRKVFFLGGHITYHEFADFGCSRMNSEVLAIRDVDLEDGELSDSSDEVYIPLQRPVLTKTAPTTPTPASNNYATNLNKMDDDCQGGDNFSKATNDEECQSDSSSSSSSDDSSDNCLTKVKKEKKSRPKKHIKRTVMVRINATAEDGTEQKRSRFKKYDIWTAALQEDALTENMRGCDVTQNGFGDRNVESYDFSLHYRLYGGNSLKRRLSGDEDTTDNEQQQPQNKRQRPSSRGECNSRSSSKQSVHQRLGKKRNVRDSRYSSTNSSDSSYEPRLIEDLEEIEDRSAVEVAREMAKKLHEGKDDLIVRIVEVLGLELPLKIFKETQRIEADGGMTIKNGQRRRTPGGVFLFLIKHNETLSADDQKAIFSEDRTNANKKHKDMKSLMRERKVEELKKRLSEQGAELNAPLCTRKDLILMGDEALKEQQKGNLSNPPPSPEAAEQSPEYKSLPINVVSNENVEPTEKPSTSRGGAAASVEEFKTYEDDFLDVHCGDMDFF
ncbi:phosphorylated adapter RNA export protein-like [Musca domestica]|uniref:Phosphorylated adapter RNA export protein n=1 Tax=Musca domestica TaxID=7370 RepID=A0ABM3UQV3_MUSDO|nr:phosphorylated adapter RNA export protein-like [Musca domestica]